ncbi:hypothetical protein Gotri_020522 [Gossypium trilobum]|uniref:Uncharacterized protein n=1 Tax=Gossypium trilobum TaxID=34281 RepID=A0A7J9D9S9_9ROSI|nr:hypothetical protein [Gossypium trilobum]
MQLARPRLSNSTIFEFVTDLFLLRPGYESDGRSGKLTIREQLVRLVGDRDDDFTIPLGKNLKKVSPKFLTISQKRNIRRQAYLNEVSQRNDSVFFATIGAFVLVPPLIILGIAILTGLESYMLANSLKRRGITGTSTEVGMLADETVGDYWNIDMLIT